MPESKPLPAILHHACMCLVPLMSAVSGPKWLWGSGEKHGSTFLLNAVPSDSTSLPDMAARLQAQAQRFANEPVSDKELARFCKVLSRTGSLYPGRCTWLLCLGLQLIPVVSIQLLGCRGHMFMRAWKVLRWPDLLRTTVPSTMPLDACIPGTVLLRTALRDCSSCVQGARADLYGAMQSNASMASAMCKFHALTGSWRTLITDLADFGRLTGSDVQEVAASMFAEENGYTGFILPPASQSSRPLRA